MLINLFLATEALPLSNGYMKTTNQTVSKTRFPKLGYIKDALGLWRFVDLTDNSESRVGPQYKTKIELLCDMDRYVNQVFGV